MKKVFLMLCIALGVSATTIAQEYLILTSVESVVPGGLGRSRLIQEKADVNVDDFTTERTDGKKSNQGSIKRGDAKVDLFAETKLLNFYSLVGINFQNIASNDALVSDKLTKLAKEGWELKFVTSGVEGDAGKEDGTGIFITRYIFYR